MARRSKISKKQQEEEAAEFIDDTVENEEEEGPPSIDPYEVLGLEREATADDVKKSYRKLALKHHPDKAADSEKEDAHKKFQEIAFAYAVLSDDRRRKRYDLTGSTAEVLEDDDEFDWLKFFQAQFEDVVNQDSIQRISDQYKGSAEERNDLLDAYTTCRGNLNGIYQYVMLSDILEDDDRFRKIIDEEIELENIDSYSAYEKENNDADREKAKAAERKRRENFVKHHGEDAADKAKAKQKGKKSNGSSDLGDLAALIQQRQKARAGGFFDQLEAKYVPKSKSQSKKRATPMEDEPTEEEFLAASKKLKRPSGRAAKKQVIEDDQEDEDIGDEDSDDSDDEDEKPKAKAKKRGAPAKGRSRTKAKA